MNALETKLTFDARRGRAYHLHLAKDCREAARRNPQFTRPLRAKMRLHALQARGKIS